jgi:phosphoribosylformylglycinamidine cyclo-ligase
VSPAFHWLQQLGDVDSDEMYRVFNMGIGLVLIVSPYYAESIQQQLATCSLKSWIIGRVIEGEHGVRWA